MANKSIIRRIDPELHNIIEKEKKLLLELGYRCSYPRASRLIAEKAKGQQTVILGNNKKWKKWF